MKLSKLEEALGYTLREALLHVDSYIRTNNKLAADAGMFEYIRMLSRYRKDISTAYLVVCATTYELYKAQVEKIKTI